MIPLRKAWEVVGYVDTEQGCAYCLEHGNSETMYPIFITDEWDYYPSCDTCLCAITDVTVIGGCNE